MFVSEDGRVTGSIDRARVAELLAGTDDEELKAYYRDLLGESEEGKAIDEPADEPEAEESEVTESPPASMAMSKPELVELAQGKVDDPESKTKAELVEALGGEA